MESQSYALIAALIVVLTTLSEVIKVLVTKVLKKNGNGNGNGKVYGNNPINFYELQNNVNRLVEITEAKDQNGVHLCYFPRDVIEQQKEMLDILRDIRGLMGNRHND